MNTGAVIVAAGMSSRMGDFKPMLNIGSISIAQRLVATFRQAGVTDIVMVTGYNAQALEHHLANNGIVFLRNERYAETEMFDSARIGLEYLCGKCDNILFTPVDIPLFTSGTVERLLACGAKLACPVCGGQSGHPILISSPVVEVLLRDSGEGGLRGAISRCGVEMERIEVDDAGILHDADTPADYQALLQYHNSQLIRPIVSVSLAKEKVFFDSRSAMLLSLVDETHSVRTACTRMQISYSSAWNMIRTLESQLCCRLIERSQGGSGGGQSVITAEGRALIDAFRRFCEKLQSEAAACFDEFFGDILK